MTRREVESVEDRIREHLRRDDLDSAVELLRALSPGDALDLLDRSEPRMVPVLFRLLDKSTAVHVFAAMETGQQSDLVRKLQDGQVQDLFAELRVSGQARLLDEMPANVAVVQPGGSVRDEEVVAAAEAAGVTLYLTGARHFFHG